MVGQCSTTHAIAFWMSSAPSVSLSAWCDGCIFLRVNSLEAFEHVRVREGLEGRCREMNVLMPRWEESVGKGSVKERPRT